MISKILKSGYFLIAVVVGLLLGLAALLGILRSIPMVTAEETHYD